MRTLDINEFNLVSGASVYETEDAIIWNRMPGMQSPHASITDMIFGTQNTIEADQIAIAALQAKTNKPVMEVW